MENTAPNTPITADERLDALEFFLGNALLDIECDNVAIHDHLARLDAAINAIAPGKLAPPTEEEEDHEPFTLDSLGSGIQFCVQAMRRHKSVKARQMVAIGELTTRVLNLGSDLTPETPPAIGPDALSALRKAKRQPPPA